MRRLRGWEPRTIYTYDGDRLVSSQPEPEWDDESRDLLTAFLILEGRTGPNGEYLPTATSPGAAPEDYTSGFRYVVDGPFTNWAERARLDALDQHREAAGEKANLNGVFFTPRLLEFDVPT